jgi:LmbE family N-acetylglucosaminyl deacetylase
MTDLARLGTVLSIWAHPDDETYLTGGLSAALRDAGARVVCVTATRGESADPNATPGERIALAALRTRELDEALAVLGVIDHHWLDHPDGRCADVDVDEAVEKLACLVSEVRPDTVVTFGPDGMTGHDDHRAISRWTTAAWASTVPDAALLYGTVTPQESERYSSLLAPYGVYCGSDTALGITETDRLALQLQLRGELLDRKYRALQAMPSQTAGLIGALGSDVYRAWCSEESFVSAVDVPGEAFIGGRVGAPAFELVAA